MTNNHLIPLNKRPKEEARLIQIAGGQAKSEKKTFANRIKGIKHGRYATKFNLMVQDLAKNPQTSALKIFDLIERIGTDWDSLTPKLKMDLSRLYCEAHRTIHGTKQINLNLNSELKADLEKWFKNEDNKQD